MIMKSAMISETNHGTASSLAVGAHCHFEETPLRFAAEPPFGVAKELQQIGSQAGSG